MSAKEQRKSDVAFLRHITANTQVGSAKVAMALAIDRLEAEPLVDAEKPKRSMPVPKAKAKSKVEKDSEPETKTEKESDLGEHSNDE